MSALEVFSRYGFFTPAAQWWSQPWFLIGLGLVVFFILLALVLLWVAWQSLRTTPDQRDVGDDGLLGLTTSELPPTVVQVPATNVPVGGPPPFPVASVLTEPGEPASALRTASASDTPETPAAPALPVEIRPRTTDEFVARPPASLPGTELPSVVSQADPNAPTQPLAPSPVADVSPTEHSSSPAGLLAEDIRAQLKPSTASLPASLKATAPLGASATGPLSPPPSVPEPKTIPNPPHAGLTEQLPVQRKSLRPPTAAPKTPPKDDPTQREAAPVMPSASAITTAVIATAETTVLNREDRASAIAERTDAEPLAPVVRPPMLPLPVQQIPAIQPRPPWSPAEMPPPPSSVAPPRFLADDRPTGIRREVAWLGVALVTFSIVFAGVVVVFLPNVRNRLLPPTLAERVATIPRGLGLESPPPPPPVVKQVEVRQYANTYSSVPKGASGKITRLVTIAGLVKNITNETLYDLRAEIELYPRTPEGAPPERRTIYLVPNLLGPQQEGRYTLTVADAEYRQSSLKRIVTGDGKDLKEVPAVFVQGTLSPPDEAETKPATTKPAAPNRSR